MRGLLAGLTRTRVLNLREIRTHRLRVLTSLFVVVVASALLIAVLGTYGSLTESVRVFNAAISGTADLEVAAIADSGIADDVVTEIRSDVPAAKSVVPLIRGPLTVDGKTLTLLGSDFRITALSDQLRTAVSAGGGGPGLRQADLDDGVIVGAATGFRESQRITMNGIDVRVVRVLDDADTAVLSGGNFVFAYLGLAQRLAGLDGRVDSALIVAQPGTDLATLRTDVQRVVDGRAVVVDPDFRAAQAETASSVTRDSTLLVSLISLVIAGFLVFNTMNMAVASRRQSLAMVRALGAKRIHLVGDMLGEAALFGLVGGLIGVPVGILAGRWAISRLPDDATNSAGPLIAYHLPLYAPVVAVIACVLACVAATSLAARSVFAVSPVEAMSSGEVADSAPRRAILLWASAISGIALVIASWFMATRIPDRPAIIAGAVFAVGVLLICFSLTSSLVRLVVSVSKLFGGPGRLASVNTDRAPRRAWATLMTVAVAVTVGMGTSGALDNLVSSISTSLDGLGAPNFYVSSTTKYEVPLGPVLPAPIEEQVRAVPGVDDVIGGQWMNVNVGADQVLLQGLLPGSTAPFLRKATPAASRQVLAGNGILLSNILARTLHVEAGDTLRIATPSGYHDVIVRDTVDYVALNSGTAAMSADLLATWFDRPGNTYLQVLTAPGADQDAIRRQLEQIAADNPSTGGKTVHVYSGAEALAATQASAEQSGSFTIAIQWIVAIAAAIALLNTLLLSVIERRRELGVLRAMGASRRFVSRMVLAEAAGVAVVGSVLGVILGTGLHYLADKILTSTTSINVEYSPRPSTLLFVAVAFVLCLLGSLIPAARAARMNISESILNE